MTNLFKIKTHPASKKFNTDFFKIKSVSKTSEQVIITIISEHDDLEFYTPICTIWSDDLKKEIQYIDVYRTETWADEITEFCSLGFISKELFPSFKKNQRLFISVEDHGMGKYLIHIMKADKKGVKQEFSEFYYEQAKYLGESDITKKIS